MQRKVIQKVIDELKKDKPSLDYALGILETLIESLPEVNGLLSLSVPVTPTNNNPIDDEAKALEYMARAKIESMKLLDENQ